MEPEHQESSEDQQAGCEYECSDCKHVFVADDVRMPRCQCGGYANLTALGNLQWVNGHPAVSAALETGGTLEERVERAFLGLCETIPQQAAEILVALGESGAVAERFARLMMAAWTRCDGLSERSRLVVDLVKGEKGIKRDLQAIRSDAADAETRRRIDAHRRLVIHGGPNQRPNGKIQWRDVVVFDGSDPTTDEPRRTDALRCFRATGDLMHHDSLWLLDPDDTDDNAMVWGLLMDVFEPTPDEVDWTDFPPSEPHLEAPSGCPTCGAELWPLMSGDVPSGFLYHCRHCKVDYLHAPGTLVLESVYDEDVSYAMSMGVHVAEGIQEQGTRPSPLALKRMSPLLEREFRRRLRERQHAPWTPAITQRLVELFSTTLKHHLREMTLN